MNIPIEKLKVMLPTATVRNAALTKNDPSAILYLQILKNIQHGTLVLSAQEFSRICDAIFEYYKTKKIPLPEAELEEILISYATIDEVFEFLKNCYKKISQELRQKLQIAVVDYLKDSTTVTKTR